MQSGGWEHFPHGADIGVRGWGSTKAEAFRQAALALFAIVTDPSKVEKKSSIETKIEEENDELLLFSWLGFLVSCMDIEKMLFADASVRIENHALTGFAWGEPWDRMKHEVGVEVKGPTLTLLFVGEKDGLWVAQCVVDV